MMLNHNRIHEKLLFFDELSALEQFIADEKPGTFQTSIDFSHDKRIILCGIIDWQQSPAIFLGIKFYSVNFSKDEAALVDGLCDLILNYGYARLNSLGLREVDSFLRINHLEPSFEASLNSLYPIFSKIKDALLRLIDETPAFDPKQKRSPILSIDYKKTEKTVLDDFYARPYLELSPEERQRVVEEIFIRHVDKLLLRDGGGAQVVYCDEYLVVIQYLGHCEFCSYALTTTLDYIQRVLQLETNHLGLRVITDS